MQVENSSDEVDTVFFSMNLLDGNRVVASVACNTSDLQPGQRVQASCIPDGKVKRSWTVISVENSF